MRLHSFKNIICVLLASSLNVAAGSSARRPNQMCLAVSEKSAEKKLRGQLSAWAGWGNEMNSFWSSNYQVLAILQKISVKDN